MFFYALTFVNLLNLMSDLHRRHQKLFTLCTEIDRKRGERERDKKRKGDKNMEKKKEIEREREFVNFNLTFYLCFPNFFSSKLKINFYITFFKAC